MKNKLVRLLSGFLISVFLMVGCSANNGDVKYQGTEISSKPNGSEVNKEQNKQETINKIVELFDKDIKWLEDGTKRSRGKYIEDAWKENKEDEELSALYNYDSTLFFLSLDEMEKAKEQIRKISPYYKGVYNQKIIEQGIKLFGNKDSWEKQYEVAVGVKARTEQREKSSDKTFGKNVIKYMEERYLFYDKGQNKQDKYSDTVFKEAAEKFNITLEEVNLIWDNPDYHKLVNMENQNSSSESSNTSKSTYEKEPSDDDKAFAWTAAIDIVEERLKSPFTADFPFSYYGQDIKEIGYNRFIVNSYVDAENSFGAKIRTYFSVTIKKTGENTYIVEDFQFSE